MKKIKVFDFLNWLLICIIAAANHFFHFHQSSLPNGKIDWEMKRNEGHCRPSRIEKWRMNEQWRLVLWMMRLLSSRQLSLWVRGGSCRSAPQRESERREKESNWFMKQRLAERMKPNKHSLNWLEWWLNGMKEERQSMESVWFGWMGPQAVAR